MTQREQIRKALDKELYPYILHVNGERYSVLFYDDTYYMAHCEDGLGKFGKTHCGDLVFYVECNTYNNDETKFGLYEPLKKRIFDFIIEALKDYNKILDHEYEEPELQIAGKFIHDIENKANEYYKDINLPYENINNCGGGYWIDPLRYRRITYPAKKNNVKTEHIKWDVGGGEVVIIDKKVKYFNPSYSCNGHTYPWSMPNDVTLPNGEDVYLNSEQNGGGSNWHLYKWKVIGRHFSRHWREEGGTWERREVRVPIDIEGELVEAPNYYGHHRRKRRNWTKVHEFLCKSDRDLWNVDLSKMKFHFYGKHWEDIEKEVNNYLDESCECERCRAYEAFRDAHEDNKPPRFYSFRHDFYKALHALEHGDLPDSKEVIKQCDCKGCKMYRDTKKSENYVENKFKEDLKDIFGEKKYKYITMDWKVKPQIMPWEVDTTTNIKDFKLKLTDKDIRDTIQDNYGSLELDSNRMRDNFGKIHARIQEIPFENAEAHAEEYLNELFQTQLNPDCDCKMCRILKDHDEDMVLTAFMEIMVEPIPPENYPTGLLEKHFDEKGWSYYAPTEQIKDFMDYFNKYILTGEICPCDTCQEWAEKVKYQQYLPHKEVIDPKCANPNCNNKIHNQQLIYDLSEMAKAVNHMEMDEKKIEIRTALCCSCYSGIMRKKQRRNLLYTLKPGQVVHVDDETYTIKKKGGIKQVNGEPLSELGARDCKIRLSPKLEKKINGRA